MLNAAESEGFTQRELAEVIGERFSLPIKSLSHAEAETHFTWLLRFALLDAPVSTQITRERTGWAPTRPTLFDDLRAGVYDNARCSF